MRHFLSQAARELDVEAKNLNPEVEQRLVRLDWPGNVRQLENFCRWLTVMAPGQEIRVEDLPAELYETSATANAPGNDWQTQLGSWANRQLANGSVRLLDEALPTFERTLIEIALQHTGGRRQEAARLLGWGRNTLTRKLKELELESSH
jgi:two-component system nitrogen regulation response regulator GlnG